MHENLVMMQAAGAPDSCGLLPAAAVRGSGRQQRRRVQAALRRMGSTQSNH